MAESINPLIGLRVVIVEDETMIALALEDMLTAIGCMVVGQAPTLGAARELIERSDFDLAILDMNLRGERSDPLAESLSRRGVPFVFTTGYSGEDLSASFEGFPVVQKPYLQAQIETALIAARARIKG